MTKGQITVMTVAADFHRHSPVNDCKEPINTDASQVKAYGKDYSTLFYNCIVFFNKIFVKFKLI